MFEETVTVGGVTYQLLERLGQGAFGEVFSAAPQGRASKRVAIKQVYSTEEDGICAKVQREITALQQLQHPSIVGLIGVGVEGPCISLVQQMALTDLGHLLSCATRPLPEPVFKALLQQLLQGLAHMHATGFIHRDIKPSNCLLSQQGHLQLSDLGQCSNPGSTSTSAGHSHLDPPAAAGAISAPSGVDVPSSSSSQGNQGAPGDEVCMQEEAEEAAAAAAVDEGDLTAGIGTRWYRAPELLYGCRSYGPAVDVWGAGAVAAEMLGLVPLLPGISDIDQLARMQSTLGSITLQDWPQAEQLPDWHKIAFAPCPATPWRQLLPCAPQGALELVAQLLRYDPFKRLTAAAASQHPYFASAPCPAAGPEVLQYVQQQLNGKKMRQQQLLQLHRAQQARWQQQGAQLLAAAAAAAPAVAAVQ